MKKKQRHPVRVWLERILFVILVLVALALIFNEQIKTWMVDSYSTPVTEKVVKKNASSKANYDFKTVKSLNFQTVAKARMNKSAVKVVGSIAIPDVGLYLPIGLGVDNQTLALAAGTLKPNQKMGTGNYALAGHHMIKKTVLFSPLYWKSKVGQPIYLSDANKIYEYKTSQRSYIKATDVQVINDVPNQKLVTLITCDATGAGRLMIRGTYVKTMPFKQAPAKVQKAFTQHFTIK